MKRVGTLIVIELQQYDVGTVDLGGLCYELDALLEIESQTWDFGRVDQIRIHGDHRVRLQRDTHSLVFFSEGENQFGQAHFDGRRVLHGGRLHGKIDVVPKGSEFCASYVGACSGPL